MGRAAREKRDRAIERRQEYFEKLTSASFVKRLRRTILDAGECKNSCIVSTAIYLRICREHGVKAEPLSVETYIYNKPFADWIVAHDFSHPPREEAAKLGEQGGRYLVLGGPLVREMPEEAGNWPGHLIAVVRRPGGGHPFFIDLSIDQAHRPEKRIIIDEPYGGVIDNPGFLKGETAMWFRDRASGHLVLYQASPNDTSFMDAGGWKKPPTIVMDGRTL